MGFIFIDGFEVLLEFGEGYFVAALEFTVFVSLFLDCVVGEMHELVIQILEVVILASGADVPLVIEVALHDAVHRGDQQIASDVELALIV